MSRLLIARLLITSAGVVSRHTGSVLWMDNAAFRFGKNSGETVLARTQFIDQGALSKGPYQLLSPRHSPCCGVRAATGPTIRSKSAFEPGLPWIGTCVATSSFSRLRLRYSTTALLLTFAKFPPAGGGP